MKHSPTLIIIGGFAGAGKTTLSNRLSAKYNYPVFSTDKLNDIMRELTNKSFRELSPLCYQITWQQIKVQLELGVTVILDTHMCTDTVWEGLDTLANDMPEVHIAPIILQCSLKTHEERIAHRGKTNKTHLNLGGEKLKDVLFKYEFIESLSRSDLIRIDANGSPDSVYQAAQSAPKL